MAVLTSAEELLAEGCFTVAEAVRFSRLSRSKLYVAMDEGELRYLLRGRRRLIPKKELVRYLVEGLRGGQK